MSHLRFRLSNVRFSTLRAAKSARFANCSLLKHERNREKIRLKIRLKIKAEIKIIGEIMAGIYIHIPFCRQKCSYCDFVSFPDKIGYAEAYMACVYKELKMRGE